MIAALLISAFVFATRIVQSIFLINTKFQASIPIHRLYSPACVGPGRNPEDRLPHDACDMSESSFDA